MAAAITVKRAAQEVEEEEVVAVAMEVGTADSRELAEEGTAVVVAMAAAAAAEVDTVEVEVVDTAAEDMAEGRMAEAGRIAAADGDRARNALSDI